MKNKKNTIMLIMVITISMILLTWNKSYSYKMNDIIPEEKEIERKEFGIYLQESGETYTETETFPNTGYLLNTTKTKCYEYGTNKEVENAVTQSLTNGSIDGSIIITSQKSMYCKIYFDKDEKPTVNALTLIGNTDNGTELTDNTKYTHISTVNYTLTWNDEDVAQICVKEDNGECAEKDWEQITGTSKSGTIYVTTGDEEKTIYAYLKDKANNISDVKTGEIILDTTNPTITLTEDSTKTTENSITVTVEAKDTNGISSVTCSANGNSTIVDGKYNETDKICTFNGLVAETEYTIIGETTDNTGRKNVSEVIKVKTIVAWKCAEGENLVKNTEKGESSGGYVCTKKGIQSGTHQCNCGMKCLNGVSYNRYRSYYYSQYGEDALSKCLEDVDDMVNNEDRCVLEECHWRQNASGSRYVRVLTGKSDYGCEQCPSYGCEDGYEIYSGNENSSSLLCYKAAIKG